MDCDSYPMLPPFLWWKAGSISLPTDRAGGHLLFRKKYIHQLSQESRWWLFTGLDGAEQVVGWDVHTQTFNEFYKSRFLHFNVTLHDGVCMHKITMLELYVTKVYWSLHREAGEWLRMYIQCSLVSRLSLLKEGESLVHFITCVMSRVDKT